MAVSSTVFAVFGHFQNLNLLALIHDLRAGRTVRQSWFSSSLLCPIAHGLPEGAQVQELRNERSFVVPKLYSGTTKLRSLRSDL